MESKNCQIFCLDKISEPLGPFEVFCQKVKRLMRIFKRRRNYIINLLKKYTQKSAKILNDSQKNVAVQNLQPGDLVRVRSKEEIQITLNNWNQLKGCTFLEEMWPYCGTTQRIKKHVRRFLDERDYLMKKCKGLVILEGVFCEGTKDFGKCDRSCFIFWRVEWLEKVDNR